MSSERYAIGISANNIDFYLGVKSIALFINPTSSITANGTRIASASSSISSTSSISSSAQKISFGSASSSAQSSITTSGGEILHVLLYVDSHLTTSFDSEKTGFGEASSTTSASVAISATRVKLASLSISSVSSTTFQAHKIAKASSSSSITASPNFSAKEINLATVSAIARCSVIISPPINIRPNYIDSSSIRTFLRIDGKPITNHMRDFNTVINPTFIENKNWNNRKNRYYRRASESGRKTFEISWRWLPGQREHTVDQRFSRDYLKSISDDPSHHTLEVIEEVENGSTAPITSSYVVFIRSYSETLVKRDIGNGVYYFDCSLTMEEA